MEDECFWIISYWILDAVRHGDLQPAGDAVNRGANVDARDLNSGSTPLYLACTLGHMQLAEFLVNHGANLHQQFGKRKQTLLHWAAENSSFGVASFLLSHKANVNALQSDGSTPLLLAAKHGHQYVVKLLLTNHALLTPRNASNATARSVASRGQHHQIVQMIDAIADSRPNWLQVAEQQFQAPSGQQSLF